MSAQARWVPVAVGLSMMPLSGCAAAAPSPLLGVPPGSPLPTIVRLTYTGVFAAGCGWALWVRTARPEAYRDIATTKTHHHTVPEHGL